MPETYLAHSANEAGIVQTQYAHLTGVAQLAGQFASAWGGCEEARLAGLLHDLGKYGERFQARLRGVGSHIDHWSAGAWEALTKYRALAAALCIEAHHVGLQPVEKSRLRALSPKRLLINHPMQLKPSTDTHEQLLEQLMQDGIHPVAPSVVHCPQIANTATAMLDVRMLYSTLVDADFLDTESHFNTTEPDNPYLRPAGPELQPERALQCVLEYIDQLDRRGSESVNALRSDLLSTCLDAASCARGLFTLSAPTGSGKTLAMLAFALKHAAVHDLRRIILAVPYLTIIEQTAGVYRRILEPVFGDQYILEHHSLSGTRGAQGNSDEQQKDDQARLLEQNWDAPIVITTDVQLLESLHADRPGACRKLHRIANSLMLFDEAQSIPPSLACPTLAALSHLTARYGASVLFATATQPAFDAFDDVVKKMGAPGWRPQEIVPQSLDLYNRARRVEVFWCEDGTDDTDEGLAERLLEHPQVLCVVNTKRLALKLLHRLRPFTGDGLFHLSTNMCPAHRQDVLASVRERLTMPFARCVLIATQCIEAGVDIDFPVVYREMAPLEAIAQAAGRCNRNGVRPEPGLVEVFSMQEDCRHWPNTAYRQATEITWSLLRQYGADFMDIDNPEVFRVYYQRLFNIARPEMQKQALLCAIQMQHFPLVAQEYRLIDQNTINVLVPYDLDRFADLAEQARRFGLTARWIREAQPFTLSIFRPKNSDPVMGQMEQIKTNPSPKAPLSEHWYLYCHPPGYDRDLLGLCAEESKPVWIA